MVHAVLPSVAESTFPLEQWLGGSGACPARVRLTQLPTRVHPLPRWSSSLGAEVWVKRDDETNPLYGGNKPRKLEFLLADALRRRYRSVLTFGGLGTHHGLATALFASQLGLKTTVGLVFQPVTPAVRENLLCLHALGAKLLYGQSVTRLGVVTVRELVGSFFRHDLPYMISTGGSSPLGTLGYVNAGLEFAEQVRRGELPTPEVIFVPLGSGGTVAGLTLGLRLAGVGSKVLGVLVTDIFPPTARSLFRLARKTARYLVTPRLVGSAPLQESDFAIEPGYLGKSYGAPIAEAERLTAWLREEEGIELDTTYTAKTAYALQCGVREGRWGRGPFLFWLTFSSVRLAKQLEPLPDFHELPRVFHRFFSE